MLSALELARQIEPELIELRRDLHRFPENAWEESRTGRKVADYCEALGLHVVRNVAKTGVIAILNLEISAPVIALRADMDALPIQELGTAPYKSTIQGKSHACGHDAHTAMLLGAAKLLSRLKDTLPCQVRFFFQPAEEVPRGGADVFVEEGRLSGITEIFGLHINPLLPAGTLGIRPGPFMASMDCFQIALEGVGGHGAMPHLCRDPLPVAAEIILALQTLVSRRTDPFDPAVVSVCQIEAGSAFNVTPSTVRMAGTVRSLSPALRTKLHAWVREIATGIAQTHGQKAVIDFLFGPPVLINHRESVERMSRAFQTLGGKVVDEKPTTGGEDFAVFLEKVPGSYAFLGAGDGTPATAYAFHHPCFNIDEKALTWGAALFVQLICDRAGQVGITMA